MIELFRLYNRNRVKIWAVIISILLVIIIIRFLNYIAIKQNNMEIENLTNNKLQDEQIDKESNIMTSIISDKELSKEQTESTSTIDLFFKYINEQNIQASYDLLTVECKDLRYSDIEKFRELYVDRIYNGIELDYSIENWNSDVYLVEIKNNLMVTGSFENSVFQDYITIVSLDNGEYKLNINGYIGRSNFTKTQEQGGIKIKLKHIDKYKDFTEYTFSVKNNSIGKMYLADDSNFSDIYIEDDNEIQYNWFSNEYSIGELTFSEGEERDIVIKFNKKYSSNTLVEKIVFDNLRVETKYDISEESAKYMNYSLTLKYK